MGARSVGYDVNQPKTTWYQRIGDPRGLLVARLLLSAGLAWSCVAPGDVSPGALPWLVLGLGAAVAVGIGLWTPAALLLGAITLAARGPHPFVGTEGSLDLTGWYTHHWSSVTLALAAALPWGARYSLDAVRRSMTQLVERTAVDLNQAYLDLRPPSTGRGWAAAPITLQLATVALTVELTPNAAAVGVILLLALWLPVGRARFNSTGSTDPELTVFFDAGCGICFQTARLMTRLDTRAQLLWVANHDGERLDRHGIDPGLVERTIVVVHRDGRRTTRARAFADLFGQLPLGWPVALLLRAPGLRAAADSLYDWVARNRIRISVSLGLAACQVHLGSAPPAGLTPPHPTDPSSRARTRLEARMINWTHRAAEIGRYFTQGTRLGRV